jgi:hypothetical protein
MVLGVPLIYKKKACKQPSCRLPIDLLQLYRSKAKEWKTEVTTKPAMTYEAGKVVLVALSCPAAANEGAIRRRAQHTPICWGVDADR